MDALAHIKKQAVSGGTANPASQGEQAVASAAEAQAQAQGEVIDLTSEPPSQGAQEPEPPGAAQVHVKQEPQQDQLRPNLEDALGALMSEDFSQATAQAEAEGQAAADLAARIQREQGEKGFETWLRGLSEPVLQAAFLQTEHTNKNFVECQAYVSYIQTIQTVQICSKCRYASGCVACSRPHALRYVLKRGRPPQWWKMSTQHVLRGMCR